MRTLHGSVLALSCVAVLAGLAGLAGAAERPSLVTVSVSEDHAVQGGRWRSTLKRTAEPWACGTKKQERICVEHSVVIENRSPRTLECFANFVYTPALGGAITDRHVPGLVLPNAAREIRGRVTVSDTKVELAHLYCVERAPYARVRKSADCKYEMFGKAFETYYPEAAVRQTLEGPVVVSFLLPKRNGAATEVQVAESSLVPLLDTAALRFVTDQRFTTSCPGTRFDMRMRFELRDRFLGLTQ
jgi:TonB family protein